MIPTETFYELWNLVEDAQILKNIDLQHKSNKWRALVHVSIRHLNPTGVPRMLKYQLRSSSFTASNRATFSSFITNWQNKWEEQPIQFSAEVNWLLFYRHKNAGFQH